ncbi:SIMPL domain-containing protein [Fluviibacterium sp. DFM31]|uniref:SIMPL domain-containing protein n=1 Tax=Meridianimarinicoccus marinus TaxID=3231483 RepID=A0ABV3L8C7_9RHOB
MTRPLIPLLLSAMLMAGAAAADTPQRSITVTGEGRVAAAPDMARLQAGAVARADTAEGALAAMSDMMAAVLEALKAEGIAPEKIQTQSLGLMPLRPNRNDPGVDPLAVIGFEARSEVAVELTDLARVGPVIDTLVKAGANDISRLSFDIADPAGLRDAARKAAVADALASAKLYADAAGVELGEVLSLSEQGGGMPRPEMAGRALMADAAVPVAEGELQVTARVTLVIALD